MKDFNIGTFSVDEIVRNLVDSGIHFGGRLVTCIIVYWIGRKLIKFINKLVKRFFDKKEYDPSVESFLMSLISIALTAALIIMIVNILGVNNSSFVALLASAGVAVGMAMSGTLQNFAGGVMILLFKPYKVGDYIEAQGQAGTVKEILIFNTVLTTPDNRTIFIPNGGLSTGIIMNYSNQVNRRIEWVIGIAYGEDYDRAKNKVEELIGQDKRILHDPAPLVAVNKLNSSSVDLIIRCWTAKEDYWDVYFNLNEKVYKTFGNENIEIPFPQVKIHMAEKKS